MNVPTVTNLLPRRRKCRTDFEELKRKLLQSDEEYRQLATQHHAPRRTDPQPRPPAHYLSEPEQLEEVTLKKRQAPAERSDGKYPASHRPDGICAARRRTARRAALTTHSAFSRASAGAIATGAGPLCFCPLPSSSHSMKIDRADFRSSPPRSCRRLVLAAAQALRARRAFAALGGFLAYFFRDPERQVPQDPGARGVAGRRPRHDRRPERWPLGAAGRLEAGHDFSLADGRAHQPHAGRRAGHPHRLPAGQVPAGLRRKLQRQRAERGLDRSQRPRRSCSGRWSACSPAASSAAVVEGQDARARRARRPDEVRIAHGRLPADRCDAARARRRAGRRRRDRARDAGERPVLDNLPLAGAVAKIGRTVSVAASSCCRRCSPSRICSAATPAWSTRRAPTSTRPRCSSASRWCSTRSTASSRG